MLLVSPLRKLDVPTHSNKDKMDAHSLNASHALKSAQRLTVSGLHRHLTYCLYPKYCSHTGIQETDKKTGACVLREEKKLEQCMASKLLGLPRHFSSHDFGENTGFRLQEHTEQVRVIKHKG